MPWTLYHIPPMDSGWDLFDPLERARCTTLLSEVCCHDEECYEFELSIFDAALEAARIEARRLGWRGDISGETKVIWLPGDCAPCYGFAWKSQDKGSTYVASPIELSHLAEVCFDEVIFTPPGSEFADTGEHDFDY